MSAQCFRLFLFLGLLASVGVLSAQGQPKQPDDPNPDGGILAKIAKKGPLKADLGTIAQVDVPDNFWFIPQQNMRQFSELTQNPHSPNEMGCLLPNGDDWFVIFSYSDVGYIKDDEKDKLDANAILDSIRQGTAESNKERQRRGWPTMQIDGWQQPPFYDAQSKNLTWAILGSSEGHSVVNYNSRILGRGGVMSANLVCDPQQLNAVVPRFKSLLANYSYKPGQKYAEWRQGDKVAAYGLTALIAGGAAAAAAKSGLLGKLIKPIIAGVVVLGGVIASIFRRIFGGGESQSAN